MSVTELQEVFPDDEARRRLVLTPASEIKPRPVTWLWEGRQAIGAMGLLAGREGMGKSTLAYTLAALVTRGGLEGTFYAVPKSVLIAATEDSWEHTIVPRLIAANADLTRVFRLEVVTADNVHTGLMLPRDNRDLLDAARQTDAALLLLDPLMSRLGSLDTHKDAEVRQALEPLVAIADRAKLAVIGLIHLNKSGGASTDILSALMGSRAFSAVARHVHAVIADPDDEGRRLFGTPKNNIGRTDLPMMSFTIASYEIPTDEGPATTGRLMWGDDVNESMTEVLERSVAKSRGDDGMEMTSRAEARDWLTDYLSAAGDPVPSMDVKAEAAKVGIHAKTLGRAANDIRVTVSQEGFPRRTFWASPSEGSAK